MYVQFTSCVYGDAVAVEHFETGQVPTFLSSYEGHKIEGNFEALEHYALKRKDKKQAIKLYLYCHYPKSYQKLEWHKICSNLPLVDRNDTSDEELPSFIYTVTSVNKKKNTKVVDSLVDSDMQVPPTGNLLHEISGQEIHHDNTIGESIIDNNLSAFVSDCPSNDFNIDNVSEIYGQPSFDIRSICPKCAGTYIGESCLRCQQDAEYGASLANDVSKTGECCYTNLLKNFCIRIFRKLLQSILLTHVTRTLMSEASDTKKSLKGIFHNEK